MAQAHRHRRPRQVEPKVRVFPTTRWTLVRALAAGDDGQRRASLSAFYEAYRPAFHTFLKLRFGNAYDEEGRDDLIQEFILTKCISANLVGTADPARGHLRSLLSASLHNFVVSDLRRKDRGNAKQYRSYEASLAAELLASDAEGSDCFDVAWAGQVIARASESLRLQWSKRENELTWRVFKASVIRPLLDDTPEPIAEALAVQLGTSRATAHRHRERAKQAFRAELRAVLGEYVDDPRDIDLEVANLVNALRETPKEVLRQACASIFSADEPLC